MELKRPCLPKEFLVSGKRDEIQYALLHRHRIVAIRAVHQLGGEGRFCKRIQQKKRSDHRRSGFFLLLGDKIN